MNFFKDPLDFTFRHIGEHGRVFKTQILGTVRIVFKIVLMNVFDASLSTWKLTLFFYVFS